MNRWGVRYPKTRVLILDELAVLAAYFLTLLIRYGSFMRFWSGIYDGLYVYLLITQLLIQALIFFAYDLRREPVFLQDPAQNLFTVIKEKFVLLIASLLYLYVTQNGENSSRFIILSLFVLGIVFEFTFRRLFL